MIQLDDIRAGDEVVLQDLKTGNVILGDVEIRSGRYMITAFGTKIVFARDRANGLGPQMVPRIKITSHTAQLTNMA